MPVMIFIDKEEKRLKAVIIAAFKILPSCENLISINRIGELGAGVLTPRGTYFRNSRKRLESYMNRF